MEGSAESLLPDVPNDSAEIGQVKAEPECTPALAGVVPRAGPGFRGTSRSGSSPDRLFMRDAIGHSNCNSPCGGMTLGLPYRSESSGRRSDTCPDRGRDPAP